MSDLDGRYIVGRQWTRWVVLDQSWNPPQRIGRPHDTQADARAAADRLNTPTTRPQPPQQATLFNHEETPA